MRHLAILVSVAALLLAGCTVLQGPGGQSLSASGSASYQGASPGTQASDPFTCNGSAKLNVNYQLGGGSITVRVKDADGATVHTQTFSGPGQGSATDGVAGSPGPGWVVEVTRGASMGGFSGQYNVNAQC